MNTRTIAIVVLYTKDHRILLQKRHSISKWGEEWSYWGGGIDDGETKEQAAQRELEEELGYTVPDLVYLGSVEGIMTHIQTVELWHIKYEIFVSSITQDISTFHVREGDGLGLFTLAQGRSLKMSPIDAPVLDIVEHYLLNNR